MGIISLHCISVLDLLASYNSYYVGSCKVTLQNRNYIGDYLKVTRPATP